MAHEYATSDELKATISLDGESFADDDVALALSAASRGIDLLCKRRFWPDADANQIRYYTPDSERLVRTDDLITLTELASGQGDNVFATVWTLNTQFVLQPLNAAADGWPYTRVRSIDQCFHRRLRSVRVTGKFGWVAVPDGIKEATMVLASRLMHRAREAPFGLVGFAMDSGTGSVARIARNDPDVMMLAGPYIRQLVA